MEKKIIAISGNLASDVRVVEGAKGPFASGAIYAKGGKDGDVLYKFTVNKPSEKLVAHMTKGKHITLVGVEGKPDEFEGKVTPTLLTNKVMLGQGTYEYVDGDDKYIVIVGGLTRDAAQRQGTDKPFASFSLASEVYADGKAETAYFDCTMTVKPENKIVGTLTKGTQVMVVAFVGKGKDKDGNEVPAYRVNSLVLQPRKAKAGEAAEAPAEMAESDI